jgi:hypothetical protein
MTETIKITSVNHDEEIGLALQAVNQLRHPCEVAV